MPGRGGAGLGAQAGPLPFVIYCYLMVMATARRLLAALLCGLLLTGCGDVRDHAVTVHVHLDAALPAALPDAAGKDDGQTDVGRVLGLRDPDHYHYHELASGDNGGGFPSGAGGQSHSLSGLGGINLGGGRGAVIAIVAVVAVVVVVVVVWKIGTAVTSVHAAAPPTTYALSLGGGAEPAQLLHLRDGHAIRLEPALVATLEHDGYSRATLQKTGSPAALPVLVALDGTVLCVRPVGEDRSR
jgi:hypothetical protein